MGKQSLNGFSPADHVDDPITIASMHGGFFGSPQPSARIEALIAAHVPRAHIKDVADVYATKWWDYRRLSPGHSFYLMAHHYYGGVRAFARKMVKEHAHTMSGGGMRDQKNLAIYGPGLIQMTAEEIFERDQGHITGMWKAMLVADAFGIPYDQFAKLACRVAVDRLWRHLPRPHQLYSEKMGALVVEEWSRLNEERFFHPKHPLYAVEHYVGLEVQNDYRAWVIERLREIEEPLVALSNVVYVHKQLPEDMAEKHFPPMLVKRARLLAA